jgi:cytochrome c oxidase subunit 3
MSQRVEKDYLVHPQYIIMTLVLFGVTALFLGFSGAYLYNRVQQGIQPVSLPSLFYYNSLLLIASSYTLWQAKNSYKKDDTIKYRQ